MRSLVLAAVFAFGATSASAATVGVAVDGIGSDITVGNTSNVLGEGTIDFFIPLSGANCTYGVSGCGTSADSGSGGPTMSMFLKFDPVQTSIASVLTVDFEDLDLNGINDPGGFLETLRVFDSGGSALTDLITDIGGIVTGDNDQQQLSLNLGVLGSSPLWLQMTFSASLLDGTGRNTVEHLRASVAPVPLPAAGVLMLLGLGGLAAVGRRRRKAA